jgi:hypothetical protein
MLPIWNLAFRLLLPLPFPVALVGLNSIAMKVRGLSIWLCVSHYLPVCGGGVAIDDEQLAWVGVAGWGCSICSAGLISILISTVYRLGVACCPTVGSPEQRAHFQRRWTERSLLCMREKENTAVLRVCTQSRATPSTGCVFFSSSHL